MPPCRQRKRMPLAVHAMGVGACPMPNAIIDVMSVRKRVSHGWSLGFPIWELGTWCSLHCRVIEGGVL